MDFKKFLDGLGDYHAWTVQNDQEFAAWVTAMIPEWETLSFKEKRAYAKVWNFHKLYGRASEPTPRLEEVIKGMNRSDVSEKAERFDTAWAAMKKRMADRKLQG